MVPVVLEVGGLKGHQADDGCLLGRGRHVVGVEGGVDERRCLFGGGALAGSGWVIA